MIAPFVSGVISADFLSSLIRLVLRDKIDSCI